MKKWLIYYFAILNTMIALAQAPQKISYQSVIRNSSNALIINQSIGVRITILQGSASGNVVYSESQQSTTNANGLVSVEIGSGIVQSGTFTTIDWNNGPYFIKTETDPNGGNNYTITVGAASNGWSNTVVAGANAWTNTVFGYSNSYAQTVGTAGNNYTVSVGAASNGWANTVAAGANAWSNLLPAGDIKSTRVLVPAKLSTASKSGSVFKTIPGPPPNGRSSTVLCASCVQSRRFRTLKSSNPFARARLMMLSSSGPVNMPGNSVSTSIFMP